MQKVSGTKSDLKMLRDGVISLHATFGPLIFLSTY